MDLKSMLKRINGNKGLCPLGTPNDMRYAPYDMRYAPYDMRYAPYKSMK